MVIDYKRTFSHKCTLIYMIYDRAKEGRIISRESLYRVPFYVHSKGHYRNLRITKRISSRSFFSADC